MGLKRFIERILERAEPGEPSGQERAVVAILARAGLGDPPEALHRALLGALPAGTPLGDASLARITVALRGPRRDGEDGIDADHPHLEFWQTLRQRFPDNAYLAACYGDELARDGQEAAAAGELLTAFELDPALFVEFGDEILPACERLGGALWLRFRLAELRARIEGEPEVEDDDFEDVREQYSELLEDCADDPDAMARVRALGRRIDELTAADRLPRVFVRRGDWRSKR